MGAPPILVVHESEAVRETVAIVLSGDYDVATVSPLGLPACRFSGPTAPVLVLASTALAAAVRRSVPAALPLLWIGDGPVESAGTDAIPPRFSPRLLRQRVEAALSRPQRHGDDGGIAPPLIPQAAAAAMAVATTSLVPVHLCGPAGSGRHAVARGIHTRAARRGRFAATAAASLRWKALDRSDEIATLYIEGVDRLPPKRQEQLAARLAPDGTITVGTRRGVRLITSSCDDLAAAAEEGRLSPALYYRLTVLEIALPPLCERADEIPAIAAEIVARLSVTCGRPSLRLTEAALRRLRQYLWFGNLAELEAVLARTVVLNERDAIDAEDLRFSSRSAPSASSAPSDATTGHRPAASDPAPGAPLELLINELAHQFKNPLVVLKTVAHQLGSGETDPAMADLTGDAVTQMDRSLENLLHFTRIGDAERREVELVGVVRRSLADLARRCSDAASPSIHPESRTPWSRSTPSTSTTPSTTCCKQSAAISAQATACASTSPPPALWSSSCPAATTRSATRCHLARHRRRRRRAAARHRHRQGGARARRHRLRDRRRRAQQRAHHLPPTREPEDQRHMERRPRVLIVDDERSVRESLRMILKKQCEIDVAEDGRSALQKLSSNGYDLLLLDIIMPGVDGLEVLEKAVGLAQEPQVIMLTATKTVKTAVRAMKLGAYDYMTKPFDVDELLLVVERALESATLKREVEHLRDEVGQRFSLANVIGSSAPMQAVLKQVARVAPLPTTILLTGESGTGKEVIARALHQNSPRATEPMVALNCAAIPENLHEAELFGHERGAFTDAHQRKAGHFERAHRGTIFLDEIGDMDRARRPSCCACSSRAPSTASAATSRSRSTSASSPPPTAISPSAWKRGRSAPISTSASTSSRSTCRRCASAATTSCCSCATSSGARRRS